MSEAQAYWARFEERGSELFRFDTRVYLEPVDRPRSTDRPCGCIIGKNPGSAVPSAVTGELQAILLQGDHFLPSVRAVVRKAAVASGATIASGTYVQVLNLFYLCNRDLNAAKRSLLREDADQICPTERRRFAWRWFAWGGTDPVLDELKPRFRTRRQAHAFYLDGQSGEIRARVPGLTDKARHTQGMPHGRVVEHLTGLIRET